MLGRFLGIWREAVAIQTHSKRFAASRTSRRAFFEPLESRRVLAGNLDFQWPVSVDGDDQVSVSASGSNLIITLNNSVLTPVSVAGYDTVTINTGAGADAIQLNALPTGGSAAIVEDEDSNPNNTIATALDLESVPWSTSTDNSDIDDGQGGVNSDPHITVNATYNGGLDYFRFVLTETAPALRVDIDQSGETEPFDSIVRIVDANGDLVIDNDGLAAENDDHPIDNGSFSGFNSFVIADLPAGIYFIEVSHFDFTATVDYQLHVSASGHSFGSAAPPPAILIDGGSGIDQLAVSSALMPTSAIPYAVSVGPQPFEGILSHDLTTIVHYSGVETFNAGGDYNVHVDLGTLNSADTIADTTYVRPDAGGSNLLIDVNGVTYFGGGLAQLSVIEVIGSSDDDTVTIENVVQNSTVYGNAGNDVIHSSAGRDALYGGPGNDWLTGGDGDDRLYGNDGDDQLGGNNGNDVVSGGTGNDKVAGQSGVDVLLGGDGADQVTGNKDRDLLFASGATNDVGIDGDSQARGDDNDFAMLALLAFWTAPEFSLGCFVSTGDDGDNDTLFGGQGEDWFIYEAGDIVRDNQDDTLSQV